MFGLLMADSPIAAFITNGATPLLYWGKKEISHSGNTTTTDIIYPLFNFPSTWSVAFFFHCKTLDTSVYVVPVVKDGVWKINVDWVNDQPREFTVYAFVECKHIASPAWGMQVFNPAGEVVFHTGRPALSVKDVGSYTGTYKPASTGDAYRFASRVYGPSGAVINTISFVGAGKRSTGEYYVGSSSASASSNSTGLYNRSFTVVVPIIDAGYYDQFVSLPNYA